MASDGPPVEDGHKIESASKQVSLLPSASHPEGTKLGVALAMILFSLFLSISVTSVLNVNFSTRGGSVNVAYLGVPYAEPPLGNLRFRAPLPLDTTRVARQSKGKGIDATKNPEFCIQGTTGLGDAGGAGSEDCLKVNIYAQLEQSLAAIYPSSYTFTAEATQSPNVVVVSVYYRLSSFGFLAHPSFRDNGVNGDFDPGKVTITGQSAGGSSVELHLVANGGGENGKLFHQAIAQSVSRTPLPTPEQQEPLFDFYANRAGCGQGSVAAQLECLRKASVSALARAQDAGSSEVFTASGYRVWHPVIDGKIFTDVPTKSILPGKFAKVPPHSPHQQRGILSL